MKAWWYRDSVVALGLVSIPFLALLAEARDEPHWFLSAPAGQALTPPREGTVVAWGHNVHGQASVPSGTTNVVGIAAGERHSLAARSDGTVVAWGDTSYGQTDVPASLSNVLSVAAGYQHCLALKADGTVATWGTYYGYGPARVPPGLTNVVAIAGGSRHSLALKRDGAVVVWGYNDFGQKNVPAGLVNVVAIAAGYNHALALRADGTVANWGAYYTGQAFAPITPPAGLSNVVAIAAGGNHSAALKSDGTVVVWGADTLGQGNVPPLLSNVVAMAGGGDHSLALKSDGTVVGWGYDWFNQASGAASLSNIFAVAAGHNHSLALVGDGSPTVSVQPPARTAYSGSRISLLARATGSQPLRYQWQMDGINLDGATHSLLTLSNLQRTNSGTYSVVVTDALGRSVSAQAVLDVVEAAPLILTPPASQAVLPGGQAVLYVTADGSTPLSYQWRFEGEDIPGATNPVLTLTSLDYSQAGHYAVVVSNAFGSVTSASALLTIGVLVAWGNNTWGQVNAPPDLTNVVAMAAGWQHGLVLKGDGTVAAWGSDYDLSGTNYTGQTVVPTGLTNVVGIAAGVSHSLALRSDGTVVAWGGGVDGQADVPAGLANVVAVAARAFHSLALKRDGTVTAWGLNTYGQTNVPAGLSDVVAISAGGDHCLVLRSDRTLAAWGNNGWGQGSVPSNLTNVIALAAGAYHNLALRADGTVVAWGNNWYGQSTVPAGLGNVVAIAAGVFHSLALKSDGTLVAWGANASGQAAVPVGLHNVVTIAANGYFSMALVENTRPRLLIQPASQTAVVGMDVTFSVVAGGVGPLGYQWRFNDTNIAGATNASLTLTNVILAQAGNYRVVVTNTFGSVTSAPAVLIVRLTLAEALDTVGWTWSTAGNAPWFHQTRVAHDGVDAAQSGPTTHNQQSTLQTTLAGPGTLAFWWKISSQPEYDALRLYRDGILQAAISGESGWQRQTCYLAAGSQVLAWTYSKNNGGTRGQDAGWVDQVSLAPGGTGPMIAVPPEDLAVSAGGKAAFSVGAAGSPPLRYQWQLNGRDLAGATNSVLTLTNVSWDQAGTYRVVITNDFGTVASSPATLTVKVLPPVITAQPASQTVSAGTNVMLSVAAEGVPSPDYQWLFNETTLTGATSPFLTFAPVQAANAGNYRVVISNVAGVVTSAVATLTVVVQPTILESPQGSVVYAGSNAHFRVSALGSLPLSYQWQFNGENLPGETQERLSLDNVQQPKAGDYQVRVSNSFGSVTSGVATLTVVDGLPVILAPPERHVASAGATVSFSVTAIGTSPLSYQWQFNGTNLPGAIGSSLILSNVQLPDAGHYRVAVSNAHGGVLSANAGLTVLVPLLDLAHVWKFNSNCLSGSWMEGSYDDTNWLAGPGALGVEENPAVTNFIRTRLSLHDSQSRDITNYYFRAGFAFDGDPAAVTLLASNLVDDGVVVYLNGAEVYRMNMPEGPIDCTTLSPRFIPIEGVFFVTNVTAGNLVSGENVVAAEVHQTWTTGGDLVFGLILTAAGGPAGILEPPTSLPAYLGSTVELAVLAGGSPPLTYQWQFEGTNLPGATNRTLTLANLLPAQRGRYRVLVTNPFGTVTSAAATLTLEPAEVVVWGDTESRQGEIPPALTQVAAISAGYYHTLALKSDGAVTGWGENNNGQLNIPPDLTNAVAVAAPFHHSLALRSDGTVVAWGFNQYGQADVPPGLTNVAAIAGGHRHSLVLKGDGTVIGWGYNDVGQTAVPADLTEVVAIASGFYHGLALKADGTVAAWGSYYSGTRYIPMIVLEGLTNVVAVAAGANHSLALRADGTVVAWGRNDDGQATVPPDLTNIVAIAGGAGHSLALKSDGTVVGWGWDYYGQNDVPWGLSNVVAIAAGAHHSVALIGESRFVLAKALDTSDVLWNTSGESPWFGQTNVTHDGLNAAQSGGITHTQVSRLRLTVVGPGVVSFWWRVSSEPRYDTLRFYIGGVEQASLSGEVDWHQQAFLVPAGLHALEWVYAKDDTGTQGQDAAWVDTVTWAPGGSVEPSITTQPADQTVTLGMVGVLSVVSEGVPPLAYQWHRNGTAVAGGNQPTLTLPGVQDSDAGSYSVTVSNAYGAEVSSSAALTVVPVAAWGNNWYGQSSLFPELVDTVAVAAGAYHNVAVLLDGALVAWGYNGYGQLNVPPGLTRVVSAAAGVAHSLALTADGAVRAWGQNSYGQAQVPPGLADVVQVAAGGWHSLALLGDGSVVVWGRGDSGQTTVPPGLANVAGLAGGGHHSVALTADGAVVAWGDNLHGQTEVPSGLTDAVAIAAGFHHSLALKRDGTVVAWGNDWYGQSTVPPGLTQVVAIGAGGYHSVVLRTDGSVIAWGNNDYGQGNVPPDLSNVATVAGGYTHSLALVKDGLPALTIEPWNRTIVAGYPASLTVLAASSLPLTYQWLFNGIPIFGANNATLALPDTRPANAGDYSVAVSNILGAVTSRVARLTVLVPPELEPLPPSMTVPLGSNVTFAAQATGTPPLRYQWRKNGVNLPGATSPSLTLTGVQMADGGSYTVVIANIVEAVTSDPVLLLVEVPPVPAGDNFVDRVPITGATHSISGTNRWATREPGEPYHAAKFGSNSVWFSWQAAEPGIVGFQTVGSTFDTLLGVYTGEAVDALTYVTSDEDHGGYLTSVAQFNVAPAVEYQIAVDGFAGQQGTFLLTWEYTPTTDRLPVITNPPPSQTVREGIPVTLSVGVIGTQPRYQWHFNGSPIAGATNAAISLPAVQPAHVGYYTVAVTNSSGRGIVSLPAAVEIGPVPGVHSQDKLEDLIYWAAGSRGAARRGLSASPTGPGISVAAGTVDHQVVNNVNATTSAHETHCGVISRATQWLLFVPVANGTMVIHTRGGFDTNGLPLPTLLAVYGGDDAGYDPLPVACGVTNGADGYSSRVSFPAWAGVYYYVAVDALGDSPGTIPVGWALGEGPSVLVMPTNALSRRGDDLTLSVTVTAANPPAQCQWYRNGMPLPHATNTVLALTNLQSSHAGRYTVVVSNAIQTLTRFVATVELEPAAVRVAQAGFDAGTDGGAGWIYQLTGGNPDGHVVSAPGQAGETWSWVAPGRFLGDQSRIHGGSLTFDLKQAADAGAVTDPPAVKLSGGGRTLIFRCSDPAGTNWTRYRVPLREDRGWRHEDGLPALPGELRQVLVGLLSAQIQGRFTGVTDSYALDNVEFWAPCDEAAPSLSITVQSGLPPVVRLTWSTDTPCWQLEATGSLAAPDWATNLVVSSSGTSNGWNFVSVETVGGSRFFRLVPKE